LRQIISFRTEDTSSSKRQAVNPPFSPRACPSSSSAHGHCSSRCFRSRSTSARLDRPSLPTSPDDPTGRILLRLYTHRTTVRALSADFADPADLLDPRLAAPRTPYLRVFAIACIDVLLTLPMGAISLLFDLVTVPDLTFWPGWAHTHREISATPVAQWRAVGAWTRFNVGWGKWIDVALGLAMLVLFGFTREARTAYAGMLRGASTRDESTVRSGDGRWRAVLKVRACIGVVKSSSAAHARTPILSKGPGGAPHEQRVRPALVDAATPHLLVHVGSMPMVRDLEEPARRPCGPYVPPCAIRG
jgi:hypothetical protein